MTTHLSALIAPLNTNNTNSEYIFSTRRRGAQFWLLNVECWIVAAGRNVELTNDEFRCSHKMFWTRDFWTRMSPWIFLNTNYANDTNIFWHTDLTDLTDLCSRRGAHMGNTRFLNTDVTLYFLNTNTRITRIFFCTRIALCILLNTNYVSAQFRA